MNMDSLPKTQSSSTPPSTGQPIVPPTFGVSIDKERSGGIGLMENIGVAGAKEMELPKEVAAVGVKVQPTVIPLPKPIASLGVKPIGSNIPVITTTIVRPLTDDMIAYGLKQSIFESIRWLAAWCKRQAKQLAWKNNQ